MGERGAGGEDFGFQGSELWRTQTLNLYLCSRPLHLGLYPKP